MCHIAVQAPHTIGLTTHTSNQTLPPLRLQDGDQYMVVWDKELLPEGVSPEPMDYTAAKPKEVRTLCYNGPSVDSHHSQLSTLPSCDN
jgi:hypothetical protein